MSGRSTREREDVPTRAWVKGKESLEIDDGAFSSFAEYLPEVESAGGSREEKDETMVVVKAKRKSHGGPPSLRLDEVSFPLTGRAAEAIKNSNLLPEDHKPRRTPWIVRAVSKHKKYVKKPKRRKEPPVGKVINGVDEQYVLTYAMRLGIQRSVDYAAKALPDSFEKATAEKLFTNFPPEGSPVTPKHDLNHSFNVTDFAPCVFSKIRHLMGVTDEFYKNSICNSQMGFIEFIANSRSGQYFFYTADHVFMIKTLRADEKKFLLKLLPDYYAHLVSHSNDKGLEMVGSDRWASAASAKEAAARQRPGSYRGKPSPGRSASFSRRFPGTAATSSSRWHNTQSLDDDDDDDDDEYDAETCPPGWNGQRFIGPRRQSSRTQRERPDVVYGQADDEERQAELLQDASIPNNNESLLNRFYGLHCIRLRHLKRKVYFVVMASIYGGVKWQDLTYRYDLKGSSYKRKAKVDDFVLKDNDARESNLQISVGPERCRALLDACASDADFLARNGVMDYSLLLGVLHIHVPDDDDDTQMVTNGAAPTNGDVTTRSSRTLSGSIDAENLQTVVCYFLGIIDILQVYNARKHIETDLNIVKKGFKYKDCSCVPPYEYKDRFMDFLKSIIVE